MLKRSTQSMIKNKTRIKKPSPKRDVLAREGRKIKSQAGRKTLKAYMTYPHS